MKSIKLSLILIITSISLSCSEEIPIEVLPIEYPSVGAHGINFIDTLKTEYGMEKYSIIAILPEGTSLKVLVDGANFGVETSQFFQDIGWAYTRPDENSAALLFNSLRTGEIDLEISLDVMTNPQENQIEISVYENEDSLTTWTKTITIIR